MDTVKKGNNMFDIRKIQEQILFDRIRDIRNASIANDIVFGDSKDLNDAAWVKSITQKLEQTFAHDELVALRMNCQCGYDMDEKIALVQELYDSANSMEEFAGNEEAYNAGLYTQDGELYLRFLSCPCPMLASVDTLPTMTWCYCTMGYSKVLFEKVWGCEVEIELLKSIKAGDDVCLMKIIPLSPIW